MSARDHLVTPPQADSVCGACGLPAEFRFTFNRIGNQKKYRGTVLVCSDCKLKVFATLERTPDRGPVPLPARRDFPARKPAA